MKTSHWIVVMPGNVWTEDYRLHTAATECQARAAYRQDHGIARLPRGCIFYPGATA